MVSTPTHPLTQIFEADHLTVPSTAPVEAPSQTQTREVLITDATIWTATGVRIEGDLPPNVTPQ